MKRSKLWFFIFMEHVYTNTLAVPSALTTATDDDKGVVLIAHVNASLSKQIIGIGMPRPFGPPST